MKVKMIQCSSTYGHYDSKIHPSLFIFQAHQHRVGISEEILDSWSAVIPEQMLQAVNVYDVIVAVKNHLKVPDSTQKQPLLRCFF